MCLNHTPPLTRTCGLGPPALGHSGRFLVSSETQFPLLEADHHVQTLPGETTGVEGLSPITAEPRPAWLGPGTGEPGDILGHSLSPGLSGLWRGSHSCGFTPG